MLHLQTVTPTLLEIIRAVSNEPVFQHFRLVGGTALSLYLGHRMSVDADFFSNDEFDKKEAATALRRLLPGFTTLREAPHGLAGFYKEVKIDMYTWGTPFLLPPYEEDGIRLAAIPDIVALKLDAIVERKEEKDYRDAHALLIKYPLGQLLSFYRERIPFKDLRLVIDHLSAVAAAERNPSEVLFKHIEYDTVASDIVLAIQGHIAEVREMQVKAAEERLRQRVAEIRKPKE